jgi:hypothetical protein
MTGGVSKISAVGPLLPQWGSSADFFSSPANFCGAGVRVFAQKLGSTRSAKTGVTEMVGRPPKTPTKVERTRVERLVADGWSHGRIARQLGMARNTLRHHFHDELCAGADRKLAELLRLAEKAAKRGNVSAIKWLMARFDAARARDEQAAKAAEVSSRKLGKKELADLAAQQSAAGTSWAALVRH